MAGSFSAEDRGSHPFYAVYMARDEKAFAICVRRSEEAEEQEEEIRELLTEAGYKLRSPRKDLEATRREMDSIFIDQRREFWLELFHGLEVNAVR